MRKPNKTIERVILLALETSDLRDADKAHEWLIAAFAPNPKLGHCRECDHLRREHGYPGIAEDGYYGATSACQESDCKCEIYVSQAGVLG